MKPRVALNDRRRERALSLLREGKSTREAARETGAAQCSVVRWARKAGIKLPRCKALFPPELREQCLRLHRQGYKGMAIAARLGVSAVTVSKWIRQAEGRVPKPRPPRVVAPAAPPAPPEPEEPGCARCGLRGKHECMTWDYSARRHVEPLW